MDMDDAQESVATLAADEGLELKNIQQYSIEALGRAQSRSHLTIYGLLGLSIMGVALFTYFSLLDEQTSLLTPVLLCLVSFLVGLVTLVYGYMKSRSVTAAAHHDALIAATETRMLPPRSGSGGLGTTSKAEMRGGNRSGRKISSTTGRYVTRQSASSSATVRRGH